MPDLHAGFQRSDADARNDGLFAFLERVDMLHNAMVDEARRRTADLGGAVRCQVGDVQRLELGDDVLDGVRAERVLMYVPDQ